MSLLKANSSSGSGDENKNKKNESNTRVNKIKNETGLVPIDEDESQSNCSN